MGTIKIKNTFEGGLNFDTTPEAVANNELRDATNMDIYTRGKYAKLTQLDGDSEVLTYLPQTQNLNILGAFAVRALYDYDGDMIYEQNNESIIVFSYDDTNGSLIRLIDQTNGQVHQMYPNSADTTSLDFPPEGTISASFRQERSVPEIYWDDNRNPLRYMTLRWSSSPLFEYPSLRELTARRRIGGLQPILKSIEKGGQLLSGTYQFSFRFYNTTTGTSSAWSLFCNPIAIALEDNDLIDTYLAALNTPARPLALALLIGVLEGQLGGHIGQVINKKIVLDIPFQGDEYQFYDSIQLAVVKNTDGLAIPSQTAYISQPNKDWYNDPTNVEYRGGDEEKSVDVAEIVTEDAAIKCAKTQVIKDNRLFRGNITYYDFKNDRGETTFDKAENFQKDAFYKDGTQTNRNKGYFHDECYAFAIGYFDEYFNVGLVEPLDLGDMYWQNPTGLTFNVQSITLQYDDYYTLSVSSALGLSVGDFIRLNGNIVQICDITGLNLLVKGNPGSIINVLAVQLHGQRGNQANTWSWKFPERSANQFTILDKDSVPQALGLKLTGIKNYPSWAKGAVILRQKRKKNILYQMPHIPTVGVLGVPTQGIGPLTYPSDEMYSNNPTSTDWKEADYKGQFDCIAPKIFGFGTAKNVARWQRRFIAYNDNIIDRENWYYATYYPYYINQRYDHSDSVVGLVSQGNLPITGGYPNVPIYTQTNGSIDNIRYGSEIPNYIYGLVPEYVFNKNGEPTITNPIVGGEYLRAVDGVALRRKILQENEPGVKTSNSYIAIGKDEYLFRRDGFYYKANGDKVFFLSPNEIDPQLTNVTINKAINLVLGISSFTLTDKPFESEMYRDVELWGSVEQLSVQQGESNAIPASVNSFFNTTPNQRAILFNMNGKILDLTSFIYGGQYNIFPNLTIPQEVVDLTHLERDVARVNDDRRNGRDWGEITLPVKNIYSGGDLDITSAAWILNVEKGLPDDRYEKISTNWVSTGAVHYFTEQDQANNTPFDIEIWGGDCFITIANMKVNNNTHRISDRYDNIQAEADDYKSNPLDDKDFYGMFKNVKTGSYETNVEFIRLYLESEINTEYYQEQNEYPAYQGTNIGNYSKPYLFQYNGSYSVNNDLKTFVTKDTDIRDTKGRYPARIVWSDQTLYQADGSGLVDTNGFLRYRILSRKDFDEKYGEITGLIDFGDTNLHTIQQFKVRVDPVGRNIIQEATDGALTVLGQDVVGRGGYYIAFDNGSQHMRTIKYYSGTAFMVDAQKKQAVIFGASGSGFKVISQDKANAYFDIFLDNATSIKEKDLAGYIDYTNDKQEYSIIKSPYTFYPSSRGKIVIKLKNQPQLDDNIPIIFTNLAGDISILNWTFGTGVMYNVEIGATIEQTVVNMYNSLIYQLQQTNNAGLFNVSFNENKITIETANISNLYNNPEAFKIVDYPNVLGISFGYQNYINNVNEYSMIATIPPVNIPGDGIIYNTKSGIWKTKLDTGDDLIYSMLMSGERFYRLSEDKLYRAYNGDKGFLLGKYRDSKFTMVLNDYPGFSKRFNVVNFEMQGSFRLNLDEIYATAPQYNPQYSAQVSGNLLSYNPNSIQPPPFGWRNYSYWLNKIREQGNNAPMRGDYLILDFIIHNDADVGAINIVSTSTDCETAYRNR